ncbi:MAG: peptide ABC transporter substrate-binding protein, partial [Armatimonadota bacterium]
MARLLRTTWIAVLAAAVCSGCGPAKKDGQVLRIPLLVEPTTMDPARVEDGPTIEVLMHIYDGLVQWNEKNQIVPAIAKSWTLSSDGRTYTFRLRDDVRFHTGRRVTAHDFVFSINRALSPSTASTVAGTYLNDIEGAADVLSGKARTASGVRALNDHTLEIRVTRPRAYFLAKLTYPTAYVVDRECVTSGPRWTERPVGTGPFRLARWEHNSLVVLEANPDYYRGKPKLQRIERPIVLRATTRHAMYENGELHMTDVTMGDYDRDRRDPVLRLQMRVLDRPAVFYFALNQRAYPPFRDRRVRQAFAYALDKPALVRLALKGLNLPANGILPPGVPGHDPNFVGLRYNPAKARALMAEAGYPGGKGLPELTLTFREQMADLRRLAEAAAEMYRQNLGVNVKLREMEWGVFLQERNRGTLPFYLLRWMADYLDPQNFLSLMLHTNAPENVIGYSNPEFDRLCDEADGLMDQEKRLRLYRRAEEIAVSDAPWIPLFYQRDGELWKPSVKGDRNCLMGHLPHLTT